MLTTTAPGTWLVETALKGDGEPTWEIRTGCLREESARTEVRQLGARWRRQGYKVRVRFEADPSAKCMVCGRSASDPFRIRVDGVIMSGCIARIHDAHLSGDSLDWSLKSGMDRLNGWDGH